MVRTAVLLVSLLLLLNAAPASAQTAFSFGRVDDDPRSAAPRLAAFAEALAPFLPGAVAGPGLAARDLDALAEALRAGQAHYVSETPFGALELERRAGARFLLREWRRGVARYHSVVIAAGNGPVRGLADLVGRKVAFEDPGSTSAYFLPAAAMLDAGLALAPLASIRDDAQAGVVSFAFLRDEFSVPFAVAAGVAAAGAFSDGDWADLAAEEPQLHARLRVIHQTPAVIRSILVAGPAAPPEWDEPLIAAIFTLQETEQGRATLNAYNKAERYDRLTGEAAVDLVAARRLHAAADGLPDAP